MQHRRVSVHSIATHPGSWLLWLVIVCLTSGCVSTTYRYGLDRNGSAAPLDASVSSRTISFGEPPPHLARMEKIVQLPRQAIRKLSGKPPRDPEAELAQRAEALALAEEYAEVNGIGDLFIDVRTYDPQEQWRRLKANQSIHPLFRYTGGSLSWLRYTLLPRTVFRSDHFDPFTNTLSFNSDDPARVAFEMARAKEFHRERMISLGAYATLQLLPLVPLIHETRAASEALSYSEHHLEGRFLDELYPIAYGRVGSTLVSETLSVITLSPGAPLMTRPVLVGTGRLTGRSVGRWMAEDQPQPLPEEVED